MTTLGDIEALLSAQPRKPPIDKWHPALSGDIDIRIGHNGAWYHEGGVISRQPLVNLFASILRREADGEYYLVTPVEKWRIRVDDTPLIAVDMEVGLAVESKMTGESAQQKIIFRLNTDEWVVLDAEHPLSGMDSADAEPHPCIQLERGLSAKLTRALYYRLIDVAEQRDNSVGIFSCGIWFSFA